MRPQSVLALAFPLCAAALAACNGGGGTNAQRLSPQQVQGVYAVCSLRFRPSQSALPVADLLQTIISTNPPSPKQPPSLTLSGQAADYQLLYTRRSDSFTQELRGGLSYGGTAVFADLPDENSSDVRRELLLPGTVQLNYSDAPRRLTVASGASYTVRRSDYAKAAGITEEGLQDRIGGSLEGTFAVGGCP